MSTTKKPTKHAETPINNGGTDYAEQVRQAMREPSPRARVARLEEILGQLQGAMAAQEGAMAMIEAKNAEALAESAESWRANRAALSQAQDEVRHLVALQGVAETALEKAKHESPDEEILEAWARHADAFEDAKAAVAEYEALAPKVARVLQRIERGQQAFAELDTVVRRLYNRGERDPQWMAEIFQRTLGSAEPEDPFYVRRRGALHKLAQLPSLTQEAPYWGNIRGDFSLPVAERLAQQEAEVPEAQRNAPRRPAGVYADEPGATVYDN